MYLCWGGIIFSFRECLLSKIAKSQEQLLTVRKKNERAQVRSWYMARSKMGILYHVSFLDIHLKSRVSECSNSTHVTSNPNNSKATHINCVSFVQWEHPFMDTGKQQKRWYGYTQCLLLLLLPPPLLLPHPRKARADINTELLKELWLFRESSSKYDYNKHFLLNLLPMVKKLAQKQRWCSKLKYSSTLCNYYSLHQYLPQIAVSLTYNTSSNNFVCCTFL
jgi:hypothetical protein